MRFYQKRQFEMLQMVNAVLKREHEKVSGLVPALKQLIKEYDEKYSALAQLANWNPNAVMHETMNKKVVRTAFAEVVFNMMSAVKAANYRKKAPGDRQKDYTEAALKKLSAARLCELYAAIMKDAKKISNLQHYGISAEAFRDAQAYYKEFAVIKNVPAKRKKEVAAKNAKQEKSISDCIDFLEQAIDPLMHLATKEDRELRALYKSARAVLPRAQGRPSDAEAAYRKSRHHRKPLPRD
jgi:hypothetical protein